MLLCVHTQSIRSDHRSMSTTAGGSIGSLKRFVPNPARSIEEQQAMNRHLFKAAEDNEADLVLHYMSQGADPNIAGQTSC